MQQKRNLLFLFTSYGAFLFLMFGLTFNTLVFIAHRLKHCAMKESLSIYLEWTRVSSLVWLIIGLHYIHIGRFPHLVLFDFTLSHFILQY